MMTDRRVRWLVIAALLAPFVAFAADVPVPTAKLLLRDAGDPATRRARVVVKRATALDVAALPDPTVAGATLEVRGAGVGDGDTGVLALDASLWTGLGNPPGSRGWRYLDEARTTGVKKVMLKAGATGGTLKLSAAGASWPYAMTTPQTGPVEFRLGFADDVVCGRAETFLANTGEGEGCRGAGVVRALGVRRRHGRRHRGMR